MNFSNYDDVLSQMRSFGLVVVMLDIGRIRRCKVDGDRELRGWYAVHELRLGDGDTVLVGSFGIWRGNENNAQKIELGKLRQLTDDQRAALKKSLAQDRKRVDADRKRVADIAARRAKQVWEKLSTIGTCQYLDAKSVKAYGLRFSDSNCAYIPMLDGNGSVHGLQILLPEKHPRIAKTKRNKEFWPAGVVKKGHWFQLGIVRDIVLVAEGYATAASIHEATGLPVVVAFDAGNILHVVEALKKHYRSAKVLICADDDFKSEGNPGMSTASAAALSVNGAVVYPVFTIDREVGKKGLTDFNDLHLGEGLHTVRTQIEARLIELSWDANTKPRAVIPNQGGGGNERRSAVSLLSLDDAVLRFIPIDDGTGKYLFDTWTLKIAHRDQMLSLLQAGVRGDDVKRHPDWIARGAVYIDQVGFDPSCADTRIKCNMWGGWSTTAKQGCCDRLLELLDYLCSEEENYRVAFDWVVKWLAYPIQHPGAKMQTALVLHGPQGTGKNLFFEFAYLPIYGEYALVISQDALEDKFNDWASKKLFAIADEVVARNELYHSKNKLKSYITGRTIRINPKNLAAHEEKNHLNIVFQSNESHPLILEKDDRRFAVIHTPGKLSPEFYKEVRAEIDEGGIAALHHYLLTLDLGDFNEHTKPPMTKAKQDLIDQGKDSPQQFFDDWVEGRLDLPVCPCGSQELYEAYAWYCRKTGEPRIQSIKKFIGAIKHTPGWTFSPESRRHPDGKIDEKGTPDTKGNKPILLVNRATVIPPDDLMEKCYKQESKRKEDWLTNTCLKFFEALEALK